MGIFRVGVFLGGSCPGGNFPGQELSRWDLSWVGIFFDGSFPGRNCPVGIIWWEFLVGIPGGSFHVTQFFPYPFISLNFARLRIKLITMNCADHKPKGTIVNRNTLFFRQIPRRNPSIFDDSRQCQCDGNLDLYRIYVKVLCCPRNPA